MKTWLEAWSTCTTQDARHAGDAGEDADRVRRLALTGDISAVVDLIAGMAMATLQDMAIMNRGPQHRDGPS